MSKLRVLYDDSTLVNDQVVAAISRISNYHPGLGEATRLAWIDVQDNIVFASDNLIIKPPSDAFSNYEGTCPLEGMMYYDGARQKLVIKENIFNAQKTKTDKAAAYVHEAIYKVLREKYDQKDSVTARLLTGCLFSENIKKCLNLKTPSIVTPESRVWQCKDDEFKLNMIYKFKNSNWWPESAVYLKIDGHTLEVPATSIISRDTFQKYDRDTGEYYQYFTEISQKSLFVPGLEFLANPSFFALEFYPEYSRSSEPVNGVSLLLAREERESKIRKLSCERIQEGKRD